MADTSDHAIRQRAHAERMLARAERRSRQAAKLIERWTARLAQLNREGVAACQARLWAEEVQEVQAQPQKESRAESAHRSMGL